MASQSGNGKVLRDEMLAVFRRAKLPSCPSVAARILELISDPESTATDFARAIESDPAIAARLLTMANSAYFGQRGSITNIKRALTLVGLRQLRLIVLGFELVGHLDRLAGRHFDLPAFWRNAVLRACIARSIARRSADGLQEEAFLVGLLQDCGVLLLAQILGPEYAKLYHALADRPHAFHEAERQRFPYTHVQAITVLAEEWRIPDVIATPIARHHEPPVLGAHATDIERLAAVAYVAGGLSLGGAPTDPEVHDELSRFCREKLVLGEEEIAACLHESLEDFRPSAALFEIPVPPDIDVADLLAEANRHLTRAVRDLGEHVRLVEDERDLVHRENLAIRHALGQYRDRAARDPLTDLLNRGAVLAEADERLAAAGAEGVPVVVMFLDLDNFKRTNDVFGHAVGDKLLAAVAEILRDALSATGVAGRYGGEEFVLIEIGTSAAESRRRAQRILDAVRDLELPDVGLFNSASCSIGVLWVSQGPKEGVDPLITRADELMYRAKQDGKNRACFRACTVVDGHVDSRDAHDVEVLGALVQPDDLRFSSEPLGEQDLRRIAEELNRQAQRQVGSTRKIERLPSMTTAELTVMHSGHTEPVQEECFVRNTSLGGVGLLVARRLRKGEILELRIDRGDDTIYIAGVVAFCRQLAGAIHELGLQLLQHAHEPILSGDPDVVARNLALFQRTLDDRDQPRSNVRRSA